jgi:PAS domain S-box-containing protein
VLLVQSGAGGHGSIQKSSDPVNHYHTFHRRKDGSRIEVSLTTSPIYDAGGRRIGASTIARDVTERARAAEALRQSEDQLRLILDSTAEAIFGIDRECRCTFCNPATLRLLGYERVSDLLGRNMHSLMHHSRASGEPFPVAECRVLDVFRTGSGIHVDDEVFWRSDATSFPVEYWCHPQRKGQEIMGVVVAFVDITERKLAEEALSSVSRRLIDAQERERTRIARELHDDIVQRLALLTIGLDELQQRSSAMPAELVNRISDVRDQAAEITVDVQSLSHELHSSKLQYLGLAAAMKGFCEEFGEQQHVDVDFAFRDLPNPVAQDISLCLFRVLQEALRNSAKHSKVSKFEVNLWGTDLDVHLKVSDLGAGFHPDAAAGRGLGLVSMQERLQLVNGTLSIQSQPERGTTIHARVPLSSSGDSMLAAG